MRKTAKAAKESAQTRTSANAAEDAAQTATPVPAARQTVYRGAKRTAVQSTTPEENDKVNSATYTNSIASFISWDYFDITFCECAPTLIWK